MLPISLLLSERELEVCVFFKLNNLLLKGW